MRRILIPAVLSVACALVAFELAQVRPVEAHAGATGVVKERMDLMKVLGDEVKALAKMFKGESPYDPAAVAASAARIEGHAGGHMLRLFPEGSMGHPSEAKQHIWHHWPEFEAAADDLGTQASALAAAADSGPDGAKAAFGKVVATCKACHQDFKED